MRPSIKRLFSASWVLVFCLLSSVAAGGGTFVEEVEILSSNPNGAHDSGFARGAVSSARFSADSVQAISCETETDRQVYQFGFFSVTGTASFAWCFAHDAKSNIASCITTDPNMIATAGRINDTSAVLFAWDKSATCTEIQVFNSSQLIH